MSIFINIIILVFSFSAFAELTNEQKALHLLNRFSYGPLKGQVQQLSKKGHKGLESWFDDQLNVKSDNEKLINEKLKNFKSLTYSNQQLLSFYPQKKLIEKMKLSKDDIEGGPRQILTELVMQKLLRAAESENQLQEVMLDFWFNHFNVNFDKGPVRHTVTSYERDTIRPFIFGKFEDMLMAVAKSPAMLLYLDNHQSRSGKINENYARELLELHTLGVDGGYTQTDIQETARVLTGWGVNKPKQISEFKFYKKQHDSGSKKVLGLVFSGNEGLSEGEKLIKYLAQHKNTARFIAKKLAIKFITDNPSDETINEISKVFTESGGDLKKVYKAIFSSKQFWSSQNVSAKIKTPLEYLISMVRLTDSEFLTSTKKLNLLKAFFEQSGQPLYRCQIPTGFKATADFWVNSGALVRRINLSLALAKNQIEQVDFNKTKFLSEIQNNNYVNQIDLIDYINENYFNRIIKKETLIKLDKLLLDSESYRQTAESKLALYYYPTDKIIALMLSSPEFQRR